MRCPLILQRLKILLITAVITAFQMIVKTIDCNFLVVSSRLSNISSSAIWPKKKALPATFNSREQFFFKLVRMGEKKIR